MEKSKVGTQMLSTVMALMMLLGLLPASALATDEKTYQQTYDFMMYYGETGYASGLSATASSESELPEVSSVNATVDSMAYDKTDSDWVAVNTLLQNVYTGTIKTLYVIKTSVNQVEWPADTAFQVVYGSWWGTTLPKVYYLKDNRLTEVQEVEISANADGASSSLTWSASEIGGTIVLLDPTGLTEKTQNQYSYQENSLGLTLTAKSLKTLPNPNEVTFTATMIYEGDLYNTIQEKIGDKYSGTPIFMVMDFNVTDKTSDEAVTWPEDTEFVVNGYLSSNTLPLIFLWDGTALNKISEVTDKGVNTGLYYFEYQTSDIHNMVWLSPDGLTEKDASQIALETGHYTVTANMYVKGANNEVLTGTTAYLTNPGLPPA